MALGHSYELMARFHCFRVPRLLFQIAHQLVEARF